MAYFNSTMGWLWARHPWIWCSQWSISIPLWDDCEFLACEGILGLGLFQFHYGMIVRRLAMVACISAFSFQFHYGMIVRAETLPTPLPHRNFNSTMGWLWGYQVLLGRRCRPISIPLWDDCELSTHLAIYLLMMYFNSTMGWLWADLWRQWQLPIRFQFHYGMIVRATAFYIAYYLIDFNSTMGWLWVNAPQIAHHAANGFQFHYGMIVSRKIIKKKYWFTACSIN